MSIHHIHCQLLVDNENTVDRAPGWGVYTFISGVYAIIWLIVDYYKKRRITIEVVLSISAI